MIKQKSISKRYILILRAIVWCVFCITSLGLNAQDTTYFFISPNGKNASTGTKNDPLGSIQGAFDRLKTDAREAHQTIVIELADGRYSISPTELSPKINGAMNAQILIKAAHQGQAILDAGARIPLDDFQKVTEQGFVGRIQTHLRDSIVFIKLSDLGIRNIRQYADIFDGNGGLVIRI